MTNPNDDRPALPFPAQPEATAQTPLKPAVEVKQAVPTTQPRMPTTPVRLSAIVKSIPAIECHLIFRNWEAGVAAEVIRALPEIGKTFKKTILTELGEEVTLEQQEELVLPDERFEVWLNEQRQESRYAVLRHVGNLETSLTRLEQGADDFERLLSLRRLRLTRDKPARRGRKAR